MAMTGSRASTPLPLGPAPGPRDLSVYRPNVGLVLFNPQGEVFLGRRAHDRSDHPWQYPQGGIDPGEAPLDAAWRELHEETGVTARCANLIVGLEDWLVYDFPPDVLAKKRAKGRNNLGQKQKWFAFEFTGAACDIDLSAHEEVEFSSYKWGRLDEAAELVIPWKKAVYEEVAVQFAHIPAQLARL